MVFNRLKTDFVLVRFRDNTYGIVYQKRYSNTLSRKLEKRARVLFRGNTRSCIKKILDRCSGSKKSSVPSVFTVRQ